MSMTWATTEGGPGSEEVEICRGRVTYELLGPKDGRPVVLTPGGRFSKDVPGLRPLAEALAAGGMRVLIWDRPNCGASDIQLWGESESHMRAEVLAELLTTLGLAPCLIAGGSGGARDSVLTVMNHPEVASKLALWNIVGGTYSTLNLAMVYALPSIRAVRVGGMDAVVAMPEWQQMIATNPRNERILRDLGAEEFSVVMRRWLEAYVPKAGFTIPGVPDWMFERVRLPTMIIRAGRQDVDHPTRTSMEVHCLIEGSRLVEPPWPEDAWERAVEAQAQGRGNIFDPWVQVAPLILELAAS
jgi:pimeloyl-ACP methyl ester carboxylesterase